jgi:uncharacterized protein
VQPAEDIPFFFACESEELLGILTVPEHAGTSAMIVVVGGPQYRVGSHRQFVHLARRVAAQGVTSMRFDYRGMGDSSGAMRPFDTIDTDLRAAVDALLAKRPGIERIALWGLCDGASAVCFYAASDPRITDVVLVNPWVRTESGQAQTQLRHYYGQRLLERAFWRKVFHLELDLRGSLGELFAKVGAVALGRKRAASGAGLPLPERMATDLGRFGGRVLLILSSNDYTAREFDLARSASATWSQALRRAEFKTVEADHTFSNEAAKGTVAEITAEWLTAAL